jgi:flagellar hook-associated protein 2
VASISSADIGSGLDVNSIVSQLVAVERQPLQQLQKRASTMQAQLSTFGQIKSQMANLSDAANKLASATQWDGKQAASSDASAVSATITSTSAAAGVVRVQTQKLASTQSVASSALTTGASAGTGQLTFQLGSWNAGGTSFTASATAAPVTIDIAAGEDTPSAIAAKVNAAKMGIVASTITDASGTRVVFASATTGQASGFTVNTDAQGSASGLDRLTFDAGSGVSAMQKTQSASDATAIINGVTVQSPSNKLDSTLAGMTLVLSKETTSAVEVTVSADPTARRALIDGFVTAYNALNKTLSDSTVYNADAKTAGPLQGERTAISVQSALRSAMRSTMASGTYTRLVDVGIEQGRDGSLSIKEPKLAAAMAQGDDLGKLFNATGTAGVSDGIARRLKALTDGLTNTDGSLTTRTGQLQSSVKRNADDQQRLNDRVASVEKRLRAQYGALDKSMSGLNALNAYVSQQVTLWNKNSGG